MMNRTPKTKTEYELIKNGNQEYIVKLYMPQFPKGFYFMFSGSLEKCKKFISER